VGKERVLNVQHPGSRPVFAPAICFGLCGLFAAHSALIFVLYRARILQQLAFADSNALIFGGPFLLSALAYLLLLRRTLPRPRGLEGNIALAVGALLAAFVSTCVALVIVFNILGT